jgi:NRAMP (natural resistance-associated macrophage protein)-like metal ion transporter
MPTTAFPHKGGTTKSTNLFQRTKNLFAILGPGLVTGAADDDPSGVVTYTIAGAKSGTVLLWTAFLTWPLMAAVQMMCARIGMVTGEGLAGALRKKFPRWLVALVTFALLSANIINIGSDLAGMADAAQMLTGVTASLFVVILGALIALLTVRIPYRRIANVLKWLCLILLTYFVVAILSVSNWFAVLRATFVPAWPQNHDAWQNLVAILGTTISPYLFFWQASQEVEEEKMSGRRMAIRRHGPTKQKINERRLDVAIGTFASNLVMFFIIVSAASTLNVHGITNIESSRQAADALRPLAGKFASTFYTLGILGTGLLAIPTLAGSAAYAFAETFRWRQGLEQKFKRARLFYGIIIISIAAGVMVNFLHINPIKALFWSALINGLLAPFLLLGVLIVVLDKSIMRSRPSPVTVVVIGALATLVMFGAAIGMFIN